VFDMHDQHGRPTGRRNQPAPSDLSLLEPGRRSLLALVVVVVVIGAAVLTKAVIEVPHSSFNIYLVTLAVLTIASGRFVIKVPGRPATVSVSEVFVFATVLLFGPAAAALIVALDGVWVSCTQKHRRLYRTLFNVAEPAISTWIAGQVFFAIAGIPPMVQPHAGTPTILVATIGMAAVFFFLNSSLTAAAIALENGASAYEVWSRHALSLAINYYAAASLATLAVANPSGFNLEVVGLVVPLLVLSYVAYKEASTRVGEAQRHVREVKHLYQATVEMLAIAVESKDRGTHGHVCRVQRHARAVAQALGITGDADLKAIDAGSVLHDIGKLVVPDHILNKPGALTRIEYDTMKRHAIMGARILTAVEFPYPVVPIVRHHHERWDGQGYPDGLIHSEIPLGARILAVVDCFDALTSDRPYRPKLGDERAVEIVKGRSGSFYDPAVVEKFIELIPELRREDRTAEEGSEVLGSVVARMAQAAGEPIRESDAEDAMSTVAQMGAFARALIDDQVACILGAEACLFALNSAGDHLLVAHATSRLRDAVAPLQMPVGRGLSGWVVANRSTIRNADPALDFNDLAGRLGLRWCTSTPVFAQGDLVGALTVYLTRANGFSEKEAHFVGTLAQEVGLTIAHAEAERRDKADFAVAGGRGMAAIS
jgi:putative nucleotidyltransferase with HDIG domain